MKKKRVLKVSTDLVTGNPCRPLEIDSRSRRDVTRLSNKRSPYLFGVATANRTKVTTPNKYGAEIIARMSDWENASVSERPGLLLMWNRLVLSTRSRARQNFELIHINGLLQNFGRLTRNFGPPKTEFPWWEWLKMLEWHVAKCAWIRGWGVISVRRYFCDFFLFKLQFHALVFHRMKSSSD